MARFRIETVLDSSTGLILAELYHPEDADEPIASTQPVYPTHEMATQDIIRMMKEAVPDQPIKTNP